MTLPTDPALYPVQVQFSDLVVGLRVRVRGDWTNGDYLEAVTTIESIGTDDSDNAVATGAWGFVFGDPSWWNNADRTETIWVVTPPTTAIEEPPVGSVVVDEEGTAWQAVQDGEGLVWLSTGGGRATWGGLNTLHTVSPLTP